MANERCPSCQAVVRAGDPWCTLCWTDLRPAPVPPPVAVPSPVSPPVPAPGSPLGVAAPAAVAAVTPLVGGPLALATIDPLTAPLPVLLGEAPAPAGDGAAVPTWPCVQCGAANPLDLSRCGVCTTPFGGRITRIDDAKAQRRKVLLFSLGAVALFLMLLAALTFATTGTSAGPDSKPGGEPQQTIDYSTLPKG
jgi:hypothetical protein